MADTGLSDWLPGAGEGVVPFTDLAEAVAGLERINADHERHRRAARKLAEEVFSTDPVLRLLLADAMN